MVTDYSDNKKENLLPLYGQIFLITAIKMFIYVSSTDRIAHTTVFMYTSHGALAGTKNSSVDPPCIMNRCSPILFYMHHKQIG